jgi:hypothetical protein
MLMLKSGKRGILLLAVLWKRQLIDCSPEAWFKNSGRSKFRRPGTNDDDACGCHSPLGKGVVVGTCFTLVLWVKTLERIGLEDGVVLCGHLLGGVAMELQTQVPLSRSRSSVCL